MNKVPFVAFVCGLALATSFFAPFGHYSIYASLALCCLGFVVTWPKNKKDYILDMAGLKWELHNFCHNFLITGAIGAGKTEALKQILDQLFTKSPGFGALWMDNKGDSHLELIRIAEKHGRRDDVVIIEVPYDGRSVYPPQRLNLITVAGLGPDVVANILGDISCRKDSRSKDSGFFRDQTIIQITEAINFFTHSLNLPVNIATLHAFLCSRSAMLRLIADKTVEVGPDGKPTSEFWKKKNIPRAEWWYEAYMQQPDQQLGGITSSITNALSPFLQKDVASVFSSDDPDTCDLNDLNKGKIFCIVCPHSLPREKQIINQYIKSIFFYMGLRRYDERAHGDDVAENLIVAFLDEAQASIAESDRNALDKLRAVNFSFIAATQDALSFYTAVGKEVAENIIGKFRNRIVFRAESADSAEESAKLIGKHDIWKTTGVSFSGGKSTRNRSKVEEFILKPRHFLRMPDTKCAILHSSGKLRKKVKLPRA